MKARYPLKEDTVSQPGKWTTTEEGIQYLRELVVVDTRTVIRPLPPVWRSFVQSAPTSRASNLAMMNWSAIEAPTVYRLVCHLWRFKENLSSLPCYGRASQLWKDRSMRWNESKAMGRIPPPPCPYRPTSQLPRAAPSLPKGNGNVGTCCVPCCGSICVTMGRP